MSRRRYVSTDISLDKRVNQLAKSGGDFAVMLYMMMIPHADDMGYLTGDFEELTATVLPMRRDVSIEQVEEAVRIMESLALLDIDAEDHRISFPAESFYKYQTYIPADKRRGAVNTEDRRRTPSNPAQRRETPTNADEHRGSPQNPAYPSPSPSLSPTPPTPVEAPSDAPAQGKLYPAGKPLPVVVQNFIEAKGNQAPHWEAELRLELSLAEIVGSPPRYMAGILKRWEREGLPARVNASPPEPLHFPKESLLQKRLRQQEQQEANHAA